MLVNPITVFCQCAVECRRELTWKRSKGPVSFIRGTGTSATTKGFGCESSQRSMAGISTV